MALVGWFVPHPLRSGMTVVATVAKMARLFVSVIRIISVSGSRVRRRRGC